jgi:hypothetical protein
VNLRRRLERLEADSGLGAVCPECGIGSEGPVEIVVDWEGDATGPERCATCGMWLVVDWPDAPTPEEMARMEARMEAHRREHPELHHLDPADLPDYPPNSWPDEGGG